ncbi:MAG: DUF6428 family protein [Pseudorhodoplanes sp.]|jgi:hypothetical protein|nr:DUF6428 family protein [Pseudorhodoplanes sp.]
MLALAKPQSAPEISIAQLLETLDVQRGKKLIFQYNGRNVRPSYHVTEVKCGAFKAIDCGANPESWHETFIQLWDIVEQNRQHIPVG